MPSVLADEHVHPNVITALGLHLHIMEASRIQKYRGKDEREYFHDLFVANVVFATSDRIFVEELADSRNHHAGIIYLPNRWPPDDLEVFAEVAGIYVAGGCRDSPHAFHNCILHPSSEGVNLIQGNRSSELVFSWLWLFSHNE